MNTKGIRSVEPPKVDKHFILSRISEVDIFQRYLGIPVEVNGPHFCAPSCMREDRTPTCQFVSRPSGIKYVDYSGEFDGDCFDVVQYLKGCNYNLALQDIAIEFGLIEGTPIKYTKDNPSYVHVPRGKKIIETKRRDWNQHDKEYWTRFYLKRSDLEAFCVFPVEVIWIDGHYSYKYNPDDPAYAYYFGNGDYKIYFPMRETKRFLSNGGHLQGFAQLDLTDKEVIITKSMKDVIVLRRLGFNAIAPPAEGALIDKKVIDFLKPYDVTIFFDNDSTGIKWAKANSSHYGLAYFYLQELSDLKDASDVIEEYGPTKARELIRNYLNQRKKWESQEESQYLQEKERT